MITLSLECFFYMGNKTLGYINGGPDASRSQRVAFLKFLNQLTRGHGCMLTQQVAESEIQKKQ